MAYVDPDYKTKKLFKEAVKNGVVHRPYNPSGMFPVEANGSVTIEGPHSPAPHRWYAHCRVVDGIVVSVS